MAIRRNAYRALFPKLYTRKNINFWQTARVPALHFPLVRVLGPYWSLGLEIRAMEDVSEVGLDGTELSRLRILQESVFGAMDEDPILSEFTGDTKSYRHHFKAYHRPQLIRLAFDRFFSMGRGDARTKIILRPFGYAGASRLSILGINTLKEWIPVRDLGLHAPVTDGQAAEGDQGDLVVATIGDLPINTRRRNGYLPAFQLVSGRIAMRPTREYLNKVRRELALDALPNHDTDDPRAVIYALPDGIALYGALRVPWLERPVAGWYKITAKTDAGTDPVPIMTIWSDGPALTAISVDVTTWSPALQSLRRTLFSSGTEIGPQWLAIAENARIGLEDLFWPLEPEHRLEFLVHRHSDDTARVHLRDRALAIRMAYRPTNDAPISVLTINPQHYALARRDGRLVLDAPKPKRGRVSARYAFTKGELSAEELVVNPEEPLELAVPLASTADRLRDAQGLPAPDSGSVGHLWTFISIDKGWLHVPLPNATLGNLTRFVKAMGHSDTQTRDLREINDHVSRDADEPKRTTGAFGFQNRPDSPGFLPDQRLWSFTLSDVTDAYPVIEIDLETEQVERAEISLYHGTVVFEGALQVTPFRQSAERLLPDHAERALASEGLLALSPELLRGVEAQVWSVEDPEHALRLSLSIDGLRFRPGQTARGLPTVDIEGDVALTSQLKGPQFEDLRATRRPWLWSRQDQLPTVQTFPLALAGDARKHPSGSRELAPLRKRDAAPEDMILEFSDALDMQRLDPVFVSSETWERPTEGLPWLDEIGMSFLSLPSVTAHPGNAGSDLTRFVFPGFRWADGVSSDTSFEVRHDLSSLDVAFASAVLPRDPNADRDTNDKTAPAPLPATFRPQPDNGPGDDGRANSAWRSAWETLQRDAALSASDDRNMLTREDEEVRLRGVFGDVSHVVTLSPLATNLDIRDVDTSTAFFDGSESVPRVLLRAGHYSIAFDDGETEISRDGLPAEDDLIGVFGALPSGRTEGLVFGTGDVVRTEDGFYDQRGLHSKASNHHGSLVFRFIEARLDQSAGEAAVLATARRPFLGHQNSPAAGLQFWFSDLPLTSERDRLHPRAISKDNDEDWARNAVNASSYLNSHMQGYRWYLGEAPGPAAGDPDWILADGVRFLPLRLEQIELEDNAVTSVQIRGRPLLVLPGQDDEPKGTDGALPATLEMDEEGGFSLTLGQDGPLDRPIRWPLANRAQSSGPVPVLELTHWPKVSAPDGPNGMLHFRVGGHSRSEPIIAQFSGDRDVLTVDLASVPEPPEKFKGVWLAGVSLRLGRNDEGALSPESGTLLLKAPLSGGDWSAQLTFEQDLFEPDEDIRLVGGQFESDVLGVIPVEAIREHGVQQASFDGTALHLRFRSSNSGDGFFHGFERGRLEGLLSATTSLKEIGGPVYLAAGEIVLEAIVPLTTHAALDRNPQSLTLQRGREDQFFRLFGDLRLPNLFRWPNVDLSAMPDTGWTELDIPAHAAVEVAHLAVVRFEGQPVRQMPDGRWELPARVDHSIVWPPLGGEHNTDRHVSWCMFQVVRLVDLARLKAQLTAAGSTLGEDETAGAAGSAGTSAQRDWKTEPLSTLAVRDAAALDLSEETAAELLFSPNVARQAALTGPLRPAFVAATNKLSGLVVDLSAHHQLDWTEPNETDRWALLGLPHLSVLTVHGSWQPDKALEALLTCQASADQRIWVHGSDLPLPNSLVRPPKDVLAVARARTIGRMSSAKGDIGIAPGLALDLPELVQLPDKSGSHRGADFQAIFQSFSLVEVDGAPRLLALHLPALHEAVVLAVLRDRDIDGEVSAFGFAASLTDSPPSGPSGAYDRDTMNRHLDAYSQRLLGHLIAVPGTSTPERGSVPLDPHLTLLTGARDNTRFATIAQATSHAAGLTPEQRAERDRRWAAQSLFRLAPWARQGVLIREKSATNGAADRTHTLVPGPGRSDDTATRPHRPEARPVAVVPLRTPEPPQPQRVRTPAPGVPLDLPKRLGAGFEPVAHRAGLWASENSVVPGGVTDGPRLTATASEITWHLAGCAGPYLGRSSENQVFQMIDRSRIAFREAKKWASASLGNARPQRLTMALPREYQAPVPSGLLPAAEAPRHMSSVHAQDDQLQPVVPSVSLSARLSARPGVWTESRMGLSVGNSAGSGTSSAQMPVHLRAPRPPLLAINDRPRASSHEDGHLRASTVPSLILHGPRRARPGSGPGAEGLNRAPRSAWATELLLTSPKEGLVSKTWDNVLALKEGTTNTLSRWRVDKAEAWLDGRVFAGSVIGDVDDGVVASDFIHVDATGAEITLPAAAAASRPARPIAIALDFSTAFDPSDPDSARLVRRLRIGLLTSGDGLGLAEQPVFLRFDDPEYNDRLSGLAKLDYTLAPSPTPAELVFAADRRDVRIDDRIELALGLRPLPAGAAQPEFTSINNHAHFNDVPVWLKIERLRVVDGEPVNTPMRLPGQSDPTSHFVPFAGSGPALPHALEVGRLKSVDVGEAAAALLPEDQLVLRIFVGTATLIWLSFDVVTTPLYPANPARFAQLHLYEPDAGPILRAPLCSDSPPADVIELVDPRDLLDGLVRRRAIYQWIGFTRRSSPGRTAIQKISASGATWIEPDLTDGWPALTEPDAIAT